MNGMNMALQVKPIIINGVMDKKDILRVDIQVKKRPKKFPYIKELENGQRVFVIEVTQKQMDETITNYLKH